VVIVEYDLNAVNVYDKPDHLPLSFGLCFIGCGRHRLAQRATTNATGRSYGNYYSNEPDWSCDHMIELFILITFTYQCWRRLRVNPRIVG
jgi:hypothetical protein